MSCPWLLPHGTLIHEVPRATQAGVYELAEREGTFAAPEGAATLRVWRQLPEGRFLLWGETIALFNAGARRKYLDVLQGR